MKNNKVKINLEKLQIETSVSLSETYEEIERFYRENPDVISVTFPIMILSAKNMMHEKRFIKEEQGLYFYTNYPWTIINTYK